MIENICKIVTKKDPSFNTHENALKLKQFVDFLKSKDFADEKFIHQINNII